VRRRSPSISARLAARPFVAAALLALTATLLVSVLTMPGHAKKAPSNRHTYELARGVRLTTIRYPGSPNEVRILRVNQGAVRAPALEVLTASDHYPGYRQPSLLGDEAGSLAAVNGDFVAPDGRPKHLSMVNGEVWTSGIQQGPVFAVSADGQRAFMGSPHLEITAKAGTESFQIGSWNAGDPLGFRVAGFTSRGGSVEPPSGDRDPEASDPRYCAARLVPAPAVGPLGSVGAATERSYTVRVQPEPCPKTPISLSGEPDAVAITGLIDRAGGNAVRRLEAGDRVSISTRFRGWPGVVDVMGGSPLLVKDGRNVAPPYDPGDSYLYNYNPRTAVGLGKGCLDRHDATDCITFAVAVDGRQSARWSRGMRMPQLAAVLIHAGASWAMNLDGGGGTVMWVGPERRAYCESRPSTGGCLVTRPSENGRERGTSVSLAVRP
jgi:hypothetical protein